VAAPRESGTEVRRTRKRVWRKQKKRCYWCEKEIILPEDLLREFIPLDDLYQQHLADQLSGLHAQLMSKSPEFRRRWLTEVATLDHVVEHAIGGSIKEDNVVVACMPCNAARGIRFQKRLESGGLDELGSVDAADEITLKGVSGPGLPLD
jgi:5-methylcytosine-specific restriction endonuclease McrA